MIADQSVLFLAVMAFCVFFVGLAKAGFGGMIGSLAMPLAAAVSDPFTAISVLLPTYVVMDLILMVVYRKSVRFDLLWPMAVTGLVGVSIGAVFFQSFEIWLLQSMLGAISIAAALNFARTRWLTQGKEQPATPPRHIWPRAAGVAGSSGFLSFFLMGEAPAQLFLLPYRLMPVIYVATMVWFFAIMNAAKIPIMVTFGMVTPQTLILSLCFLPVMPLGLWAGNRISTRIPKDPFYILIHILLLGLGVCLIVQGAFYAP